jgi:hypothetical protein
MAVLETQVSASLFEILKLLGQLRWDTLHRVFLESAGVEPEASCLLLDVFDYSHMASDLDRAQCSGERDEVEHPSVSVVRGVFRVLTKALATTLPFGVVRLVDGYRGSWPILCVGNDKALIFTFVSYLPVLPDTPPPIWRRCSCSKAFLRTPLWTWTR